jgi:hypothetical protein
MFKKLISMVTASVLLVTCLSIITAAPASAYASNSGSSTGQTGLTITPDANGDFDVPAGIRNLNIFMDYQITTASGFQSSTVTLEAELKNNNNVVVTTANASAAGQFYSTSHYYQTTSWNPFPSTGATMPSSLNMLSFNFSFYLNANSGTTLPAGTYNFTGNIKRGGVTYSPVGNEKSIRVFTTLSGQQFTVPSLTKGTIALTHDAVTCVNRSLVTSSDTLTLRPVTTGSLTTNQTRFLLLGDNFNSTSLSSSTSLSLSSVDLTKPLLGAITFTVGSTTAGSSFSSDLSITKADGTEVSGPCYSAPTAPTVAFTTSTRLTATFTVANSSLRGTCQLFLESDSSSVVRTSGASNSNPPNGTTYTCNFSNLSQGVGYRVKVSQATFFSFSDGSFNINRSIESAYSSASLVIMSGSAAPSSPALTAEQIAAAAAFTAALAKAVEVVQAKVVLTSLIAGNKPATPQEFANADFKVRNNNVAEKVSAAMMKLSVVDRENTQKINEIINLEDFIDRVSVVDTRSTVQSRDLISRGLLSATSAYKFSVVRGLASYPRESLDSMEKIDAAVKEQIFKAEAPKRRLAEIRAMIAARRR